MIGYLKFIIFSSLLVSYVAQGEKISPENSFTSSSCSMKEDSPLKRKIREEVKSADCKRIAQFCRMQVQNRLKWGKFNDESIAQALADPDLVLASHIARYFSQPKVCEKSSCDALKDHKFVEWLFTCPDLFRDLAFANCGSWNTMGILRSIWQKENGQLDGILLNLAAGVALNAHEYSEEELLAKYDFYKQSYADGNLFVQFKTLKPWEMSIVTKTILNIGQIDDMAWAQNYLALRPKIKEGNIGQTACGLIPYRSKNKNGVSVHAGAAFYDNNPISLKIYTEYGGVCGAVSKGASGFCRVKGIPSYPIGQPGHCAFIWKKPGNHWVIGNNVCGGWNWSEGNGPIPWKGPTACIQALDHYLVMGQTEESNNAYYFALLVQSPELKDRLLEYALKQNRKNYPAWQEVLNRMKKRQGMSPEQVLTTALELNASFEEEPAVLEYLVNHHLAPNVKRLLDPFQLSALMLNRAETEESQDIYLRNLWKQARKDIPELMQMKMVYDHKTSTYLFGKWAEFYRKNDKIINSRVKMRTSVFLQKTIVSLNAYRKTRSEIVDFYMKFLTEWKDDRYISMALDFVEQSLKEITDRSVLKDTLNMGVKLAELKKSERTAEKYRERLKTLDED